jgi:hypothetical protein
MVALRLTHITYALLGAGMICGSVALCFDVRLSLLPAALVFGWAQIGGL